MTRLSFPVLLLLTLSAPSPAVDVPTPVPIPSDHYTKAELSSFRSTPSYDETLAFVRRLERTSPFLKLDFFGKSAEGRSLPVVIVSKEKRCSSQEAWKTRKPVVLILNGIHSGEIDGKDACLMILRDIALGNRPEVLGAVTLLVVPIYNVDGHERVSRFNRPNQDGPVDGMGFRTTTQGLDLNRDFMKADAPETRALLSLVESWKPDLFVDDHVTDGSDFQATLTLAWGAEVSTPRPVLEWMRHVVPLALARVEEGGYKTAPYVEWVDRNNPPSGIDIGPSAPRYSTGYFPLRQIPSILVETHSIKPYHQRVLANELFLVSLLELTGRKAGELLAARDASRSQERTASPGAPFVLDAETDFSRPEPIDFPGYEFRKEISPVTGKEVLRYAPSKPVTMNVPVFAHARPTVTVQRPAAYIVPAGWPAIEERLTAHGVRFTKLPRALSIEVGTYRASEPKLAATPYQGHVRVKAKIERRTEKRTIPVGSLYVRLDTELAGVVMHLLEPEGPDSLFQWGELSTVLEQKEYIDTRVLDPLAAKMLASEPGLKAAWEEKLKDPDFAGSPQKRIRFFYERTPYWDETLGLIPVYRLEKPLSGDSSSGGGPG